MMPEGLHNMHISVFSFSASWCFQFVCRAILLPRIPMPRAEDYVIIQHMYSAWNAKSLLLEEWKDVVVKAAMTK